MTAAGTRRDYLPPGLWYACVEIAMTHGLALKEVQVTLLRHVLEKEFNFKCTHPEEKVRIRGKDSIYCTRCWTRLIQIRPRKLDSSNRMKVTPGVYRAKPTFMDKHAEEVKPDSSLAPDLRGGE
jgi:hypothetical protein